MANDKSIRLLLLEDDHVDARLIDDILRSIRHYDYQVTHVDKLEGIREQLERQHFDVILLDVSLPPGHDPLEVIGMISSISPQTPIIALDNRFDEERASQTAKLGVQDYLYKQDINKQVFERIIRYAIERNKFINALRMSEEREKRLLNAAGEGILGIDADGNCTFINPAALLMLGYQREDQLLGKHLHSIIHHTRPDGSHCPDHECRIYRAFRQARPIHVEDDIFWRADDTSFPVDYRSVPLEIDNRIYGSVVTFSDITERKQMLADLISAHKYLEQRVEERTRHLQEANVALLKESRERMNAQNERRKALEFNTVLLETIGALVVALDNRGRIVRFNRACEQITGYSFDEVAGKYLWDFFLLPGDIDDVKAVIEDLHNQQMPNTHKNYWLTRTGDRRYISWSNTVLKDENGQVDYVIGTGLDITDQYEMEQALRKSEHSYRILANNIPAAVYRTTIRGDTLSTTYFNDMIKTMTGYDPDEIEEGQMCCFGKYLLSEDRDKVRTRINEAMINGETFEIEYRVRHRDGEIRYFIDRGRPIYDSQGELSHIDGTIVDVTDMTIVNNALKESENKFRGLTEKSLVGVYLIQDGRFQYVNPHFAAIFGYQPEEFLHKNAIQFVVREDKRRLINTIRSQLVSRGSFHTTFRCLSKSGKHIDIETYGSRTVYREKPAIIGTLLDITKRKIIEQALQEQMLRYEQILQTSMDGFLLINTQGQILDANPAYCKMLGYTSKEILDLNIIDIDTQLSQQEFNRRMAHIQNKGLASYETQNRCKTGSLIDVEISISAMTSNQTTIAAIFARDITQRKQQEASEKQSLLDIAHASRLSTMGEMATEFAHELNQPLSAISTYSSVALRLLASAANDDPDINEALQGIHSQANRAGEIIRSLRDFIGKRESSVSITHINELILLVTRLVKSEISLNQISVKLDLDKALPTLVTEKILIEQVLLNITRNAIEALSEVARRDRNLYIKSHLNNENMIEINISDSGSGLPYKNPEMVFDAFYSTKDQGMGMGLSICRSIIESHGGRLWAGENTPKGAVFSFTLPVAVEE